MPGSRTAATLPRICSRNAGCGSSVHARRLRPDTSLAAWLFTVARNLHADYCRNRLLESSHTADLAGLWARSPAPSPLDAAEAHESQRRVAEALAALPVKYREALLLTAVEGLPSPEAAAICGVTPEAMRQRVSRARARLMCLLSEKGREGLASLTEVPT